MSLYKVQKVAVLGANGLVAPATIEAFANAGFDLKLCSRSIDAARYPDHEVVRGDVFNDVDLGSAIEGCDAIHITLGQLDEYAAVQRIVEAAKKQEVRLISYVSGATVCKDNSWLSFIDAKYKSEQLIKSSGIPYIILRPTWFMESLGMMVRDGKANVMGKQPLKLRWIAAADFGDMVVKAYQNEKNYHQEFNTYGPEALTINEALEAYIQVKHPEISKVNNAPFWMLKIIAFLTGNKELKGVIPMFEYFEKTSEVGSPATADQMLGRATTTLRQWLYE